MTCTTRDSMIVEKLGQYGVLSTEQLGGIFFPKTALTTVRRRLRLLEEAGLLYRVRGLDNGGVAWALTKRTAQKIGCLYPVRHFNRNSLTHDVALSEVRRVLEGIGFAESWVPEHVLKAQAFTNRSRLDREPPFVPDAIFSIKQGPEKRVVALELELNGKSRKRYENILSRYQRKKTLWAVWYLVPNETLGKTLEKVWAEVSTVKQGDKLIWTHLGELLRNPKEARIRAAGFAYPLSALMEVKTPALAGALPESGANHKTAAEAAAAVL